MRFYFLLIFVLVSTRLLGQIIPGPEIDYRSKENPHYWKWKMPEPGYWQQDVHYQIKAQLDDATGVIDAREYTLTYWNNSPHDLNEIFFHLYQNAFIPGSYYHELNEQNHVHVKFGQYEAQGLGTTIEDLRINGKLADTIHDNTVLKVVLPETLKSGDSLVVTMRFKTYFDTGTLRRRMKTFESFDNKHFDGVHWYPTIAVFDAHAGWNTDQHLDKEFYNNFGQFDVWLTMPQEYIVEATGYLMNESEVYPDDLKEKIKLSNFFKRTPGAAASIITPKEEGKYKTWYFKAINVHNFAFTADPDYRIEEIDWNGIKIIALVEEPNAPGWKGATEFTRKLIEVYSNDFGAYIWPKIIVADARDGMEYPMLTLDNGTYPGNQYLLSHEVAHMWFYGMVGSNETYRAFMDEGFAQFLTVWAMDRITGESRTRIGRSKYVTKYLEPSISRQERLYYPYINHVQTATDEPLNTHASGFNGALRHGGNYGLVYYKAGTMLYNLRYVLGEKLFQDAMLHYVEKWKVAHPYPEDFRKAIIEFTGADLNWFFDQWMETTKYIDYGIKKVKHISDSTYAITFVRKGRMQMPIDFSVRNDKGEIFQYLIPNTWFIKETEATVLPKWFGWDLLHPEYTATITIPGKIKSVVIDPDNYLADIDLRNNKVGEGGIKKLEFDSRVPNMPQWTKQKNYHRPDAWYNNFDGLQLGWHLEGNYLKLSEYKVTAWFNTGLLQNDIDKSIKSDHQWAAFTYSYRSSLFRKWKGLSWNHSGSYNASILNMQLGMEKEFRKQDDRNPEYTNVYGFVKYLYNDGNYQRYLLYPTHWGQENGSESDYLNATINIGVTRHYKYEQGNGMLDLNIRTPFVGSDYNYSRISLNSINSFAVKKLNFRSRVFAQLGMGNMPLESQLYLAGANPEDLVDNKFFRAKAFVPNDWIGYGSQPNHFQYGGGLNLRGYAGYLAPDENGNEVFYTYKGTSGAAWNLELDFDRLVKIKPKNVFKNLHLDTYLFTDLGFIDHDYKNSTNWSKFRMDAGIGTALTIKFSYFNLNPLVVRFDMPLFLNSPPAQEDYFQMRYVFSLSRAF
jgi:hypothetical protein